MTVTTATQALSLINPFHRPAGPIDLGPVTDSDDSQSPAWTIEKIDEEVIQLDGELEGKKHSIRLRRVLLDSFHMVNRGFRWINERPHNDEKPKSID